MSHRISVSLLFCTVCVAVAACDWSASAPIAPAMAVASMNETSVLHGFSAIEDDDPAPATALVLTVGGGHANGHADIFATARQNIVEESYSFTATSDGAFPLAKGEFEGHALRFTGEAVNIHAEVTCLAIVANQVWVGARITRATVDQVEVPNSDGVPLTFRAVDNGHGPVVADAASLWFLGFASEISFCNTRPTTNALRASATGKIQVMPE